MIVHSCVVNGPATGANDTIHLLDANVRQFTAYTVGWAVGQCDWDDWLLDSFIKRLRENVWPVIDECPCRAAVWKNRYWPICTTTTT